jgi:hypothetical protein
MAQVKVADVAELTDAVLKQARMLYRIQNCDARAKKHLSPAQLAANLDREVTVQEVAAANKQIRLDIAAEKAEFSALNRELVAAWHALIPENATAGSRLRIERIVARIVRLKLPVDQKVLARDLASVCNMSY